MRVCAHMSVCRHRYKERGNDRDFILTSSLRSPYSLLKKTTFLLNTVCVLKAVVMLLAFPEYTVNSKIFSLFKTVEICFGGIE